MNLNEQQLKAIEEMAKLFYSPEDIAINLEADPDEFTELIAIHEGDIFKAYMKGWLASDMELRQSILQAALNGSSPAQQMMKDFQKQAKL